MFEVSILFFSASLFAVITFTGDDVSFLIFYLVSRDVFFDFND